MRLQLELDREEDGRWIADVTGLPGVMAYGNTREEAITKAMKLAERVLAERPGDRSSEKAELVVPLLPHRLQPA